MSCRHKSNRILTYSIRSLTVILNLEKITDADVPDTPVGISSRSVSDQDHRKTTVAGLVSIRICLNGV